LLEKTAAILLSAALTGIASAQRLSPLATRPDWSTFRAYQQTMSREQFVRLLDTVYAPGGAWKKTIQVTETSARILTGDGFYTLAFSPGDGIVREPGRYWRPKSQLPVRPADQPLKGVKIAIDPGHLGGEFAQLEERWFRIGDGKPVVEGDMTLRVAKLLQEQLGALGARVTLVRSTPGPVTSARPGTLVDPARTALKERSEPVTPDSLRSESDRLFFRVSEIRERAVRVNSKIQPDLVICLHFNAEAWGDPAKPTLVEENHLHLLLTGGFSEKELDYEDQRFNMLTKLLSRAFAEELAVSRVVAEKMAVSTLLPPYTYRGDRAVNVDGNPYLWARNLLANRLFACPVIYLEPYVMNSHEGYARAQAGDYPGRRNFAGVERESIYREYANSVVRGLVTYFSQP